MVHQDVHLTLSLGSSPITFQFPFGYFGHTPLSPDYMTQSFMVFRVNYTK